MKPSLNLKLSHQLKLTPQLQEAIHLLSLSTFELRLFIQQKLESNPMLEIDEENAPEQEIIEDPTTIELTDSKETSIDLQTQDKIPEDLPVDTAWDDIYPTAQTTEGTKLSSAEPQPAGFQESISATSESLKDHLSWQMDLTPFSDTDRTIAETIIDAINDDGFLTCSLGDIQSTLLNQHKLLEEDITLEVIEVVLHRIQQFDPIGVGARNLKECLLIQLNQIDETFPWLAQAKIIVKDHLAELAAHEYEKIINALKIDQNSFEQILAIIHSLNPRSGSKLAQTNTEYVVPDVIVSKKEGRWHVSLNEEIAPKIRLNPEYSTYVKRASTSKDNDYMREQLQEARWFIKSLMHRNETLLSVATHIIKRQLGFIKYGESALNPLVLREIAQDTNLHVSTISRVTTGKYIHTPRGIFELKYFFCSHVQKHSGETCSSPAIRTTIKNMIAKENPNRPYSDEQIAKHLQNEGIDIARRTIAKYRKLMRIGSSTERKHLH